MRSLKFAALSLVLGAATPALAQAGRDPVLPRDLNETLRELMDDLKPALSEMFRLMKRLEDIDDPRHYTLPEVLPNGDIIIRRRPDAPPYRPRRDDEPEDGETKT